MNGYVGPPPGGPAGGFARLRARWLQSERPILTSRLWHPGARALAGALPMRHGGAARARCMASKIADQARQAQMPRSPATKPDAVSYEDALAELEQLVQAMERAQMPLDQMLSSYRRGAELLQLCHGRLQAVEDQVKLLEDGQMKPWAAA